MRTQPLVIALTGYAFYLAVYCPCARTMSCHLPQFFSAIDGTRSRTATSLVGEPSDTVVQGDELVI